MFGLFDNIVGTGQVRVRIMVNNNKKKSYTFSNTFGIRFVFYLTAVCAICLIALLDYLMSICCSMAAHAIRFHSKVRGIRFFVICRYMRIPGLFIFAISYK